LKIMIKHVRITNFKSLDDVSVDLEPITVLIGRSGTGKSNFLAAMRYLRDCVKTLNGQFASGNMGGWSRINPATANGPVSLSFSIRFVGPVEEYYYLLVFHPDANAQVKEEKLALGERVLFHRDSGRWIQAPPVVTPPPPNAATLLLGAVTGVREITRAHLLLGNGLALAHASR
jgi:predicted ATPase